MRRIKNTIQRKYQRALSSLLLIGMLIIGSSPSFGSYLRNVRGGIRVRRLSPPAAARP